MRSCAHCNILLCFPEPLRGRLPLHGSHQLPDPEVASTIISELLIHPSCSHLKLSGGITTGMFVGGLTRISLPGRLTPHTLPNGKSILANGTHNQGSAQALADFVAILLPSLPTPNDSFNLTYVLGLSRPPLKQPLDILASLFSSLLSRTYPNVRMNVAALTFSPPDDTPWVKAEPPSTIYDRVKTHRPPARLWPPSEGRVFYRMRWIGQLSFPEMVS